MEVEGVNAWENYAQKEAGIVVMICLLLNRWDIKVEINDMDERLIKKAMLHPGSGRKEYADGTKVIRNML